MRCELPNIPVFVNINKFPSLLFPAARILVAIIPNPFIIYDFVLPILVIAVDPQVLLAEELPFVNIIAIILNPYHDFKPRCASQIPLRITRFSITTSIFHSCSIEHMDFHISGMVNPSAMFPRDLIHPTSLLSSFMYASLAARISTMRHFYVVTHDRMMTSNNYHENFNIMNVNFAFFIQ